LWDTKISLDGDGGFSVIQFCDRQHHFIFKPVSVQVSLFRIRAGGPI
jgi:hypothetical protein